MATITREQIRPYRTLDGRPFPVGMFPEATGQSVPAGRFLKQLADLSSGRVRKAGATTPTSTFASGLTIAGVMADPFTNRTATSDIKSDELGVFLATSNVVFRIHVSAGTGNQNLAAAQVGSKYGLIDLGSSGASGIIALNISQTTNTYMTVLKLIHDVGDTNGAVEAVFENDKILMGD